MNKNRLIKKKKTKEKKPTGRKKTNEEKEKKSELTGLTRQTWDPCHEILITKQKKNLILTNYILKNNN